MRDDEAVRAALETIFDADTGIYRERGFQRRVGFGARPALVHIDLANAWTRPGHAFSCDGMETIIPAVQALNEAGPCQGRPGRVHDDRVPGRRRLELGHGPLGAQDPRRAPEGRHRGRRDRQPDRPRGRRAADREEARERVPRDAALELPQRPGRRHGDHHGRDDGGLRPAHGRGRDRRGLPADRRPGGRGRPRPRCRRMEPVRHRREVRRRRAARPRARVPRRDRAVHEPRRRRTAHAQTA